MTSEQGSEWWPYGDRKGSGTGKGVTAAVLGECYQQTAVDGGGQGAEDEGRPSVSLQDEEKKGRRK